MIGKPFPTMRIESAPYHSTKTITIPSAPLCSLRIHPAYPNPDLNIPRG
jgi:hypothetical protein